MSVNIAMSSGVLFDGQPEVKPAFPFVKALKAVNAVLKERRPGTKDLFRVLVITGEPESVKETLKKHQLEELVLPVSKENFVEGLKSPNIHLFLSESKEDVEQALKSGTAAAVVRKPTTMEEVQVATPMLRIAFDGDAVIFSNESEMVTKEQGLQKFKENERNKAEDPMTPGPFKGFLEALVGLRQQLHDEDVKKKNPIRIYLVTSRDGGDPAYRALKTLRSWGLEMDEAVFLGGSPKGPTLKNIRPHMFFDDQERHVKAALEVGIVAGWAPDDSLNGPKSV